MIETKNLEWAVEHGTFLDNYPGSDDYNLAYTSLETVKIEGEE